MMKIEEAVGMFYGLKRGKVGDHERPHKPALLLAVLDLVETGSLQANRVHPSDRLKALFGDYFEIVKQGNDQRTPENPFYYLSSEPFWSLHPRKPDGPQSWSGLQRLVDYAVIDSDLFALMLDPVHRAILRGALISRYFAKHRDSILLLSRRKTESDEESSRPEGVKEVPGRDAAFRKIVVEIYDYRCAACGLRIYLDRIILVEAAHLIPWSNSHDDNPRNGIALCRNHHYAMDRNLISPGADRMWHVSSRLDRRRDGEKQLIDVDDLPILLPTDGRFHPYEDALEWRKQRLLV